MKRSKLYAEMKRTYLYDEQYDGIFLVVLRGIGPFENAALERRTSRR